MAYPVLDHYITVYMPVIVCYSAHVEAFTLLVASVYQKTPVTRMLISATGNMRFQAEDSGVYSHPWFNTTRLESTHRLWTNEVGNRPSENFFFALCISDVEGIIQ